jgi:hypothetical protein
MNQYNDIIKKLQSELISKEAEHLTILDDVKEKTKAYLAKLKSDHNGQISEKDDLISTLKVIIIFINIIIFIINIIIILLESIRES